MTIHFLEDYREKKIKPQEWTNIANQNVYPYRCNQCESEKFTLFETGVVRCSKCAAVMNNIEVRKI